MKMIPNTITLVNLFLGCAAIVAAFGGMPAVAAILILICSALDYLDGAAARWLRAGSVTGRYLDALADLVSFGVAPASILYQYLVLSLYMVNPGSSPFVWPLMAFLVAVFSALRLAMFAAGDREQAHFVGLPTPANALLIASIPFVLEYVSPANPVHQFLVGLTSTFHALLVLTMVLSVLLVAPINMFSLKAKSLRWSENRIRYLFLAGCVALLIFFGLAAAPLLLIFYIFLSLAGNLWPGLLSIRKNGGR